MVGAVCPLIAARGSAVREIAVGSARDALAAQVIADAAAQGDPAAELFTAEAQDLLGRARVRRARARRLRASAARAAARGFDQLSRYGSDVALEQDDAAARMEAAVVRGVRESHSGAGYGYVSPEEQRMLNRKDFEESQTAAGLERVYASVLDQLMAESGNYGDDESDEETAPALAGQVGQFAETFGGDLPLLFGAGCYGGFWDKFKASKEKLEERLAKKRKKLAKMENQLEALEDLGKSGLKVRWFTMRINRLEKSIDRIKGKLGKLDQAGKKMRASEAKAATMHKAETQVVKEAKAQPAVSEEDLMQTQLNDLSEAEEEALLDKELDDLLSEADLDDVEDPFADEALMAGIEVFGAAPYRVAALQKRRAQLRSAARAAHRRRPLPVVHRVAKPTSPSASGPPLRSRPKVSLWMPAGRPRSYAARERRLANFMAHLVPGPDMAPHAHWFGAAATPHDTALVTASNALRKAGYAVGIGSPGGTQMEIQASMAPVHVLQAAAIEAHQASGGVAPIEVSDGSIVYDTASALVEAWPSAAASPAPTRLPGAPHTLSKRDLSRRRAKLEARAQAHRGMGPQPLRRLASPASRGIRRWRRRGSSNGLPEQTETGRRVFVGYFARRAEAYGGANIDRTDPDAFGGFWDNLKSWWGNLWGTTQTKVQQTQERQQAALQARKAARAPLTPGVQQAQKDWMAERARRRGAIKLQHQTFTPAVKARREALLAAQAARRKAVWEAHQSYTPDVAQGRQAILARRAQRLEEGRRAARQARQDTRLAQQIEYAPGTGQMEEVSGLYGAGPLETFVQPGLSRGQRVQLLARHADQAMAVFGPSLVEGLTLEEAADEAGLPDDDIDILGDLAI